MFKIIDIPNDLKAKELLLESYVSLINDNIRKGIYGEVLDIIEGRIFKSSLANVEFRRKTKKFFNIDIETDDYNVIFKQIKKQIIYKVVDWIIECPEYFISNIGKSNISGFALLTLLIRVLLDPKYKDKDFLSQSSLKNIQLIVVKDEEKEHLVSISQLPNTNLNSLEYNVNSFLRNTLSKHRKTEEPGIDKVIDLFAKNMFHRVKNKNITFNNVTIISMFITEIEKSEYNIDSDFKKLIKRKESKEENLKLQFVDILYKSVLKINKFNTNNLGYKKFIDNELKPIGFLKEFNDIVKYNFEERENKKALKIKKQTLTIKKFKEEMNNIMEIFPIIIYQNSSYDGLNKIKEKSNYIKTINRKNLGGKISDIEHSFGLEFNRYLSAKYYTFNLAIDRLQIINFFKIILEYDTLGYITQTTELERLKENKFFKLAVDKKIIKIESGLDIIDKKSIKYKNKDKAISSFSKSLNTRRDLNFKTISLFKNKTPLIRLFKDNSNSYYIDTKSDMPLTKKFLYIKKIFDKLEISEKKYRLFINKFLHLDALIINIPLTDKCNINKLNNTFIHDVLDDIFTNNKFINNILLEVYKNKFWDEETKKIFINKFVDNVVSMNLLGGNLDKYKGLFNIAGKLIKIQLDIKDVLLLHKLEDYNKIYWDKKQTIINDKINILSKQFAIEKETIEISKKMNNVEELLSLLKRIKDTKGYLEAFNINNKYIDFSSLNISREEYNVNILPHNNYSSILATSVRGVCIDIDSEYKAEQLNSNFINIVVSNKENVPILWGLLAFSYSINKETQEKKYFYVLNNLQGSINNNKINTEKVHSDIMEIFNRLILNEDNNIENIFTREQFFNAINITDGLSNFNPGNKIYLPKKARLDFNINQKNEIVFENQIFYKVADR